MSNKENGNTKTIVIVALVILVAVGGYLWYQDQQSDSVSISAGGKTLSATVK